VVRWSEEAVWIGKGAGIWMSTEAGVWLRAQTAEAHKETGEITIAHFCMYMFYTSLFQIIAFGYVGGTL